MSQVSSKAAEDHRTPWKYKSTFDAARQMYRLEGMRAFYSGLTPAMFGLTHVAIQFPLYEFFKMQFTGLEMGQNTSDKNQIHYLGIAGATFLSKVCASCATYPHEVLRTRLQTQQRIWPSHNDEGISFRGSATGRSSGTPRPPKSASSDGMIHIPRYHGVVRTIRTILREEGWRAFYNGMGTNMIRAVPAAMTTMLTFEILKKSCAQLQEEGKRALEEGV